MARQRNSHKDGVGIHSVAAAARVSIATVSRTMNGTAYVSPHLRKRVLQAIDELDYIQNSHARSLRSARSKLLGFMISEPIQSAFSHLIQHFEDAAFLQGYAVLIGTVNAARRGTDVLIRRMIQQGVDGVAILTNTVEQELIDPFLRHNIPLLCLKPNRETPGMTVLGADMNDAANQSVQHLAVLGHRQIAFAGSHSDDDFLEMPASSFSLAMSRIGMRVGQEWIVKDGCDSGEDLGIIQEMLEQCAPTAIVCSSDVVAFKTLRAASSMGLQVPGDLSVVGYGDIFLARYSNPPLTTIHMSQSDLATRAVDLLCRSEEQRERYQSPARRVDLTLMVRHSTSFPRTTSRLHAPTSSNHAQLG